MMSALAALILAAPLVAPVPPPAEVRGLWVVRTALVSPREVDRVVDEAAAAGFNTLLVQVRGRGDAFYRSRLVPRSHLLAGQPESFDLLAADFPIALPRGHVLAEHPEWAMVPRRAAQAALGAKRSELLALIRRSARAEGDIEGYYLSPAVAQVHRHLAEVVRELITSYPVDGLHLDFIRYPGPAYDWSRTALEGFRQQRAAGNDLLKGPEADPAGWASWRRGVLDTLARELTTTARASRPRILISAAVVPDQAQALHQKFQNWPAWMARGLLDALCPMTYTPDTRIFRRQLEQAQARVAGPIWAGVGAWRLPLEGTIEKIETARLAGTAGVVVFSHESLGPGDAARLRQRVFGRVSAATAAAASGVAAGDAAAAQ
jgi:uncharacterized lipoprotein YddW (UPF0748 family)